MGIYFDHGIEYHVVQSSGRHVCIANTQQTDARLLASKFYERHKDSWFKNTGSQCVKIDQSEIVDIDLTKDEQDVLTTTSDNIMHGWYDVITFSDTYGL